jgi:O-antigen/teichoic acid export membrane protein
VSAREKNPGVRAFHWIGQPLFANAGYMLGIYLVASLAGFLYWGLAARLYRAEEVGLASAILSAAALISGLADLGVSISLVRFLPEAKLPHRLINTALTFSAVVSTLIGGAFLAGLSLWSPSLMVLQRDALYAAAFLAYTTTTTLETVVRFVFVARRQAGYALAHTCVINASRLLLMVMLTGLGAAGLVCSVALAFLVAVALSLLGFLPKVEAGYRLRPGISRLDLAGMLPYSVGNYVATLLTQASPMLLPLIVLEVLGPASSGYAYVAWMLGALLTSPGLALAGSAFAEGANSPQRLTGIMTRAVAGGLLVTLAAALVVGLAAPWVLLLFGPRYAQEASGLVRWLAAAAPLAVLVGLYFTYLRVQKRVGRLILFSAAIAAVTLGLAAAWMPRLGIAANGVGWLIGNGLVAAVAVGHWSRDIFRSRRKVVPMSETKELTCGERRPVVAAAIPCYNEAHFVGDVVGRALRHVDTVVVVDDGSTDDTAEVARVAGARVLRHLTNMGPGTAAHDCLQAGLDLGADVLVTLDGDGQHDPDEIAEVIAPVLAGEADLVIGSRFMGRYNNVAAYRRFGINVITFLYNLGARTQITDAQSCFRAYNRRALETLHITEPGFGFSVETLVQARNACLRIREASITCVYHAESHSMNPVLHGLGVALMVVKHRLLGALSALAGSAAPIEPAEKEQIAA